MPKTFVDRLQTIDHLIQKRSTGNAAALAVRLDVSERTAKEFIAVIKGLGAPYLLQPKSPILLLCTKWQVCFAVRNLATLSLTLFSHPCSIVAR